MNPEASLATVPVLEVFLSSTIEDFSRYRLGVKNALDGVEIACFLPKSWVTAHASVVRECQERVQRANAFLLLLGHWYGSIPPDSRKSITHIEYQWACEKWPEDRLRPIAVFRPTLGSEADQELSQAAAEIVSTRKLNKKSMSSGSKHFIMRSVTPGMLSMNSKISTS